MSWSINMFLLRYILMITIMTLHDYKNSLILIVYNDKILITIGFGSVRVEQECERPSYRLLMCGIILLCS